MCGSRVLLMLFLQKPENAVFRGRGYENKSEKKKK